MFRRAFAAVAAVAGLVALTAAPAFAGTITLTNGNNGQVTVVRPGDQISVTLKAIEDGGSTWKWSVPTSSNPLALRRTAGSSSPNGDVTATFSADEMGPSTITATRTCTSTCPLVVLPWLVTITIA